jgi:peroxiredoxin
MHSVKMHTFVLFVLLAGCGNMMDDLSPSGHSKVPAVQSGTTGPYVGQNAPDFTLSDTLGNNITLTSVYPTTKGVVLYFTMWCPICDTHLEQLRDAIIPSFPSLRYFAVDYVSGNVVNAQNTAVQNGFGGAPFTVLVDTNQGVYKSYKANMGTTVVIDAAGAIRMNEDYKDGVRLQSILASFP